MLKLNSSCPSVRLVLMALVALSALCCSSRMFAQTSIATGSIVGNVTDATGAVLPNAKVTVTGPTGQTLHATTNGSGSYSLGALIPGGYQVRVEAKGFKTSQLTLDVKVDNASNGSIKLEIGQESTVVEVQGSEIQVNTEQATVQGVLTASQIENMPVNGRNFLDLAQLEPGVQIQDGQNFDPTKAGYSSISFGGRFGRTARIEVDGVDVSDETVGTTTTDIPASGIQEFQIGQASLDMSTELTSSGSVNVTTKSGTNAIHGEAFGQFRDFRAGAAALPGGVNPYYQRSQYGADVGGPIIKNKLFFFGDGERTTQNTQTPVPISAPFQAYSGNFSDPFREDNLLGRLDYQLTKSARAFYRFSYFKNLLGATFGFGYSVYDNKDVTRNDVVGVDFNTGAFTHSIRFSYLKFQNQIVDATTGSNSLPFANIGAEIFMGSTGLVAGPNLLAPQSTPQSDHEIKYDGSRVLGTHVIRYGVTFNHLQGGGFASFFKNGPQVIAAVTTTDIQNAATGPFPGGSSNPLNYPASGGYVLGNGLGFSTTKSALGFPAGGLGPDNRMLFYLGDSWKLKPNFTVTYGLRYERDTGRTDSQYAAIPELNSLLPGIGNTVNQPNKNFGPDLGFAWDPARNGKTAIRGGIGLFWENAVWNNVLFDGPFREPTGAFLQTPSPCASAGSPAPIQTSTGVITATSAVCGTAAGGFPLIGNALPALLALQAQYQAASPLNLQQPNPNFAGQYLTDCAGGTNCFFNPGNNMFNPNYRSPRSVVMNIGIQRELRPGMVLSVDFIRNVQTHFLLGVDENHAGDISTFNVGGASAAIATTLANCGATSVVLSYSAPCPTDPANGTTDIVNGVPTWVPRPTNIADFASQGLGSSTDMGGSSCLAAVGHPCAFGGINPSAPPLRFLSPVGRSVYDGLQMKWVDNVKRPFRGATNLNFQVSYALSRFDNSGGAVAADSVVTASSGDQDFIVPAEDNANVNRYFGPSTLDRTHQLSFGGFVDLRGGFQLGIMSHFYSPLSTTLTVPNTGLGAGEIFRTDFTGDGTTQDPIPGTKVGQFDRGINASNINSVISSFNSNVVGKPTPAGNVLVQSGLMTQADLVALGAVANAGAPLPSAPAGQVNYSWLKAFDATLAWSHSFFDGRLSVKPSVAFFNLPNFANFDLPTSMMSGLLTGSTGSINGTNYAGHLVNRVGVGTGVYTLGSPREAEFGLKIIF
ncbi:MAG TPA: carboxypeptidase regulatory-like domain-containing protein [Candidatus Acidoferrales bacterium]|nr:carboxypeptidase regulatory-like domain-containing protein [Candidatus Acidoferrales bacterium]